MLAGDSDYKYGSSVVLSADFTMHGHSACASADEGTTAAPAAFNTKRMTHAQAVGRLLLMSWNAGGGARELPALLDQLGHHVFATQEAHQQHYVAVGHTQVGLAA